MPPRGWRELRQFVGRSLSVAAGAGLRIHLDAFGAEDLVETECGKRSRSRIRKQRPRALLGDYEDACFLGERALVRVRPRATDVSARRLSSSVKEARRTPPARSPSARSRIKAANAPSACGRRCSRSHDHRVVRGCTRSRSARTKRIGRLRLSRSCTRARPAGATPESGQRSRAFRRSPRGRIPPAPDRGREGEGHVSGARAFSEDEL